MSMKEIPSRETWKKWIPERVRAKLSENTPNICYFHIVVTTVTRIAAGVLSALPQWARHANVVMTNDVNVSAITKA